MKSIRKIIIHSLSRFLIVSLVVWFVYFPSASADTLQLRPRDCTNDKELRCDHFRVSIPKQSEITQVQLKFSWVAVDDDETLSQKRDYSEGAITKGLPLVIVDEVDDKVSQEEGEEVKEEEEEEEQVKPEEEAKVSEPLSWLQRSIPTAFAQETPEETGLKKMVDDKTIATEAVAETLSGELTAESTEQKDDKDKDKDDKEKEKTEAETIDEQPEPLDYYEVFYSLEEGSDWQTAGKISPDGDQETTLELPLLTEKQIDQLQIKLVSLANSKTKRTMKVAEMWIEASYLPPKMSGPDFSMSVVKQDIQVGDLRAVILERGGMQELWYSVSESVSAGGVWTQLKGDGAVDAGSPLAIKDQTIFWLDKNQQTIFGFNVEQQSIFGQSISDQPSGESGSLTLKFDRLDNARFWQIGLNPLTSQFEFTQSRDE